MMEPWRRLDLLSRRGRKAIGFHCPRKPFVPRQLTEAEERAWQEEIAYYEWRYQSEMSELYGEDEA